MKHIHRLIVTSNAYRQQSSIAAANDPNRAIDPDNSALWRMNVRRMEAEIIRDSTLARRGPARHRRWPVRSSTRIRE